MLQFLYIFCYTQFEKLYYFHFVCKGYLILFSGTYIIVYTYNTVLFHLNLSVLFAKHFLILVIMIVTYIVLSQKHGILQKIAIMTLQQKIFIQKHTIKNYDAIPLYT